MVKIGIYIAFMILAAILFTKYINQESLHTIVENTGSFGVILFFIIELIYVTFTPLLNTFILIAAGYLFGGNTGFVINFFATSMGLFLIILLVKKYGRPLLKKIISPKFYNNFDKITQKVGPITLLIVYVLPFTPDDELTYIIAAGPIKFKRFIAPILLGTFAKSAYSYIGSNGVEGAYIAMYVRIVLLILGLIVVGIQEYVIRKNSKSKRGKFNI